VTRAKISQYSATANDNTDVNGINIAENCPPSSMNNMGREIMAALKRFQVGSDGDGVTVGGSLVVSGSTTVNTFNVDVISEKTSAAGVTIDGVLLKDNGVVTGAGTVSAPVYSTTGDTNTGIFFPAADTIAFAEGGAEAMRIDSSGNVGIGTSSPAVKLDIAGTGTQTLSINRTDAATAGALQLLAANNSCQIGTTGPKTLSIFTNNVERMRIDSSGNVGIGTTSPENALHVLTSGAGNGTITRFARTNAGNTQTLQININPDTPLVSYVSTGTAAGGHAFITGSTERMRITSDGDLLVGTTSAPTGSTGGAGFQASTNSRRILRLASTSTGSSNLAEFYNPNGLVGSISTNASATAYTTSSDYRLKEDWQPLTGAITRLNQLKPVNFAWKVDGSRVDGFLAHEAQEVVPESVTGEKDAVDAEGKPFYQGIDQSKLVPLLTAALQEAVAKIAALEARLDAANL
jgi:hypothetical protein